MKTIYNRFHNTEAKSNLAGCADLTDLDYYAQKENPEHKRYSDTRRRLIKALCPHNGVRCSCWAMTVTAEE